MIDAVAARAIGVLIRNPAADARFPDTSDLDFVVLGNVDDLCSERMRLKMRTGEHIMADLTWLPWELVRDAEGAAGRGLLPHRLLASRVIWDAGAGLDRLCKEIRSHMYIAEIQQKRSAILFGIGLETVREIGITWDCPALALFWLHMGYAACLGAFLDGLQHLCPNVYTRPFDYMDAVDPVLLPAIRDQWLEALRLDVGLMPMIAALRRIHAAIVPRFPEPVWPSVIRSGTRFEYRYWLSRHEIEWRIAVAEEMLRRGDSVSAVFYLRFCAYAIARVPIVHDCAVESRAVSFLRPERAMFPQLQRLAPFIVRDLNFILAGTHSLNTDEVKKSMEMLIGFRDRCIACLKSRGVPLPELQLWEPCLPPSVKHSHEPAGELAMQPAPGTSHASQTALR